jgi:hypothetical protein
MFETHKKGEKTDAQVGLADREVGKSAVGIRRKPKRGVEEARGDEAKGKPTGFR